MSILKTRDCEHCPLSWEQRGEEDADAGCWFYGDLYGNRLMCYAPDFLKNAIRRRKECEYDSQWDGIGEWYEGECRKDEAMRNAIKSLLEEKELCFCHKGIDGTLYERNSDEVLFEGALHIRYEYEEALRNDTV